MQPIRQDCGGHYSRNIGFTNVGKHQKKDETKKSKTEINQSSQIGRQVFAQQDHRLETIKNRLQGKLRTQPPALPEVALLNTINLIAIARAQ